MANLDYFYPFDSVNGDRKTTAATERRFWGGLFSDGVVGGGGFPITGDGGVYTVGEGLAIVGGAVGGLVRARSVTAKPAMGVKQYIVLRLDTTSAVRSMALEVVALPERNTDAQLENGGIRDLPLYAVEGLTGGGYGLLDLREYCRSFDKDAFAQNFQALYGSTQEEAAAMLDAARVNLAAAIAEVNAETAGLYGSMGRQGFMNPVFAVNQRGSSFYGVYKDSSFTYDRWRVNFEGANSNGTAYVQREQQGERLALSIDYKGFAGTAPAVASLSQNVEGGVRAFCASGKRFTVSFDAKASAAARLAVEPTQYAATGGVGVTIPAQTVDLTTEWQRFSLTFEGTLTPEAASQFADVLKVAFFFGWRGHEARFGADQSAAATFYLANMQLNEGGAALPCYARPYADELAACQRYYAQFGGVSLSAGATLATTNQAITSPLPLPRRMYRMPTVSTTDRADAYDVASAEIAAGGWRNGLAFAVSDQSAENPVFVVTNTDGSAVTRVVFNSVTADAEIMD